MKPLTIYWNELSLPIDLVQEDLIENGPWSERASSVYEALQCVWRIQPRARISVDKGRLHTYIFGKHIFSWLELWLGKDRVRRLKGSRLIQSDNEVAALLNEFECEVSFGGVVGDGLTRAHIAETWVWSLGNAKTATDVVSISAQESKLDVNGDLESQVVSIPNLAEVAHAQHWGHNIAAWDQVESNNCVIGSVDGNSVLMYPFDHGYPHVHVKVTEQPQCVYKYRVDSFMPLASSSETLDDTMRNWVNANSDSLKESWQRCQKGKHPLKIVGQ
jgi:hypothetical protein